MSTVSDLGLFIRKCTPLAANRVDRLADSIPMKRGGTPEEVAHSILWLLSDNASYITGTFIEVAGGR